MLRFHQISLFASQSDRQICSLGQLSDNPLAQTHGK